tara:strand:+ start:342 stop:1172 length:831 start_codon:yes stop_codon:yes gene_type:complete
MANKNKAHMNFGQIKDVYNEILAESISTGDKGKKGLFKDYVKTLRENEILKSQFFIYSNIQNKFEENESRAIEFIKENINLMDKFTEKEINEANKTLMLDLVFENVKPYHAEDKLATDRVKELHENISKLITTKKGPSTISSLVETTQKVAQYVTTNKKEEEVIVEGLDEVILSSKELGSLMVSRYNDRYSDLSESEIKTVKLILESDENGRESFFKLNISECIKLVNAKLEGSSDSLKETLLSLKESLLDRKYIKESFDTDIIKVLELKEDLTAE